jgi:hypothetical protein
MTIRVGAVAGFCRDVTAAARVAAGGAQGEADERCANAGAGEVAGTRRLAATAP